MTYSFPLAPGSYQLRLHFSEVWDGTATVGGRVFDVNAEGRPLLTNFDIFAEAGYRRALIKQFEIDVNDGTLEIDFMRLVENPKVNAIEILPASSLMIDPNAIEFGALDVSSTSAPAPVTLTNTGAAPLDITSIQIGGADPGCFATDAASAYDLPGGGSASFNVYFTPSHGGPHNAVLEIHYGDSGGPALVPLSGVGNVPGAPELMVSPMALDFGTVQVTGLGGPLAVTLTNVGEGTLDVSSIQLTGEQSNHFATNAAASYTLGTGQSAVFDVSYRPTVAGPSAANLVIVSNASTATVTLSGVAEPAPSGAPTSYFINAGGSNYIDGSGNLWQSDQGFFNTGMIHMEPAAIAGTNDAPLYQDERWDPPLAPEMLYSFPVASGQYRVRLHFAEVWSGTAFVGGRVFNVQIEGVPVLTNFDIYAEAGFQTAHIRQFDVPVADGTLDIEFAHVVQNPKINAIEIYQISSVTASPASIDFGNVDVSSTSAPAQVTVTNNRANPLNINSVQITGPDAPQFATDAAPSHTVPAGGSIAFGVVFTPTSGGQHGATLEIHSDDTTSPQRVSLAGNGVVPGAAELVVNPTTLNFGAVQLPGSAGPLSVTLTNTGNATLDVSSIGLSGPQSGHFAVDAAAGYTLGPNESASFTVTYLPDTAGSSSASLIIESNAPTQTVSLNGTAESAPPPTAASYRVNAGGPGFTDPQGNVWDADTGFHNTGDVYSNPVPIAGTDKPALYQINRWDRPPAPEMVYSFPAAAGEYLVQLHFAEIWSGTGFVGARVFNVQIEGAPVLTNYDILADAGFETAIAKEFNVDVTDGSLDVAFFHVVENPLISGIEVFPLVVQPQPALQATPTSLDFGTVQLPGSAGPQQVALTNIGNAPVDVHAISISGAQAGHFVTDAAPPYTIGVSDTVTFSVTYAPLAAGPSLGQLNIDSNAPGITVALMGTAELPPPEPTTLYRVNAGGPQYIDNAANVWQSDEGFHNTGNPFGVSNHIDGTPDVPIYQTERWDPAEAPEMTYAFPVDAGHYRVRLHFAEIWTGGFSSGARVFGVAIEGNQALSGFDIYGEAGALTAIIKEFDVDVTDGSLEVTLTHEIENPKISALEVVHLGALVDLQVTPDLLEWGHVAPGELGEVKDITLFNPHAQPIVVNEIAFLNNKGNGHDFSAEINGTVYEGDHDDIAHPVNLAIQPGQTVVVHALFAPTHVDDNDVSLEFRGNFPAKQVQLRGIGSQGAGHPFLHVVINVDPVFVDYDGNGSETVVLDGSFSHTHQIGHDLTSFDWTEAGASIGSGQVLTRDFARGDYAVTLTIEDDNVPPETLSGSNTFSIVGPDNVPGAIVHYHPASDGNPQGLLDAVLGAPDFGERTPTLRIEASNGTVGASPFAGSVLVRMLARVEIETQDNYTFQTTGGNGTRLWLNGAPLNGPLSLSPGVYDIEARFAVGTPAELPIEVLLAQGGGASDHIHDEHLTHDETSMTPVINSAPSQGPPAGGFPVTLTGLGFFPAAQVTVHWGGVNLGGSQIQTTPETISFTAPAGQGSIGVSVSTPGGVSNTVPFAYTTEGPLPVQFSVSNLIPNVTMPTQAAWGPDGRLYVGSVIGQINAYTFDDQYNVIGTQTINTIGGLPNLNILGIAFSPFDSPGQVRIFVAHDLLFAHGGTCFSGPSTYWGQVSVLTGPDFSTVQPLITGLPASNHDHGVNGMQFLDNGDLLVCVGGNTNAGVEDCNIGGLPESPLAGGIIKARLSDPGFNGQVTYRELIGGAANNDQVFGDVVEVDPGVDVAPYALGLRNSFDLVMTTLGLVYATDNGPNHGFGAASTSATTQGPEPEAPDELNLIELGFYYGHPNRNLGLFDDRLNVYHDQSPPTQPGVFDQILETFTASTNGIDEYRAQTFGGAMRGDLVLQQWNGSTYRVKLSADGRDVVSKTNLPSLHALDIVAGPGGVLLGVDHSGNEIVIARPIGATTDSFDVFDIFPWRAPVQGGNRFEISGVGFGNLGDTSVTIGAIPAGLTSVSPTRIVGTIPARSDAPLNLQDVAVTVGGQSRSLPAAFRYLVTPPADNGAQAELIVDSGGDINSSSTYNSGSFQLTNQSGAGQKIEQISIDISGALMPDSVFDPFGSGGDAVAKDLTIDSSSGVAVTGHGFDRPRGGGFDVLNVTFNDFEPGESVEFSIDIDPTNIKGASSPGPNHSGSISGMDLTGSVVTARLSDGTRLRGELYLVPGSLVASRVTLKAAPPDRPNLAAVGITATNAPVSNANHTVRVFGPAGAEARLMHVESALFLQGVPGGGFDIDPFESNTALSVSELMGVIGPQGYADFAVTLRKTDADGGINVFTAVTKQNGEIGPTGGQLILDYQP